MAKSFQNLRYFRAKFFFVNFCAIFSGHVICLRFYQFYAYKFSYYFNTALYRFLETETSDKIFMGRDQELKWLAFSLYPLSFFLYSPFKENNFLLSWGKSLVLNEQLASIFVEDSFTTLLHLERNSREFIKVNYTPIALACKNSLGDYIHQNCRYIGRKVVILCFTNIENCFII